ncbi:flagellar biosynthesis protein FlgN [Aliiroseovarius lamellibrachiae]|uniref:flagellar biosynthesis protein FlgN n=1 Tax=Aliiroseovarius lamellibrachiae TaxID=1924933 RepID=UPI001BE10316|nr:flagellar biosynthesis protein FlgN [Aliiroseovarius lamellibrachiae]MBT2132266.1 flagellar biosynthesis protein FlgN [Aliiroseovarius lamellibrachiae]
MALFNLLPVPEALRALLDQERQLLLTGKIEALTKIAPEKERLLSHLAGSTDDAGLLDQLRRKADRNQELLVAVSKGIRAVSRRLELLRTQKTQLRTYDSVGQSQNLTRRKSTFEKRS